MKTFYGQVEGIGQTRASRGGSKASGIESSVQHADVSFTTRMYLGRQGELRLQARWREGASGFGGSLLFDGTPERYVAALETAMGC